jgi:uncharacterized protein HemX
MNDFFTKYPFAKDLAKLLLQALLVLAAGYGLLGPVKEQQQAQTHRLEAQNEHVIKQNDELKIQNKILRRSVRLQEADARHWDIPVPIEEK